MRPRILLAITAYNGRAFVPRAVESAVRLKGGDAYDLDILVLDDCSPEPGWSDELHDICERLGALHYRSPRNLGIPGNVSLGMRTALRQGYDYVVIANSDVIFPANLLDEMLSCFGHDRVGSVTAWSNNVSAYSLPNNDPDSNLANQDVVDWISATLAGNYSGSVMDIPAAISFCIMIPTDVIRHVGVMDPVFGRGYCEETDWSLRSLAMGYRICLAPAAFVYHSGGGTNREAGLIGDNETTVPANEAIIDLRYPLFRDQVEAFMGSGVLDKAHDDGIREIIRQAGRQFGYTVDVSWLMTKRHAGSAVQCFIAPSGIPTVRADYLGFSRELPLPESLEVLDALENFFGRAAEHISMLDHAIIPSLDAADSPIPVDDRYLYPTRV